MDNNDPADLDGDGNFDALDISIMEEERGARRPINNNGSSGCCVFWLVLGSVAGSGWWCVGHYLI
jgi:hypothetical protein